VSRNGLLSVDTGRPELVGARGHQLCLLKGESVLDFIRLTIKLTGMRPLPVAKT